MHWIVGRDEPWWAAPSAWVERSGCDALGCDDDSFLVEQPLRVVDRHRIEQILTFRQRRYTADAAVIVPHLRRRRLLGDCTRLAPGSAIGRRTTDSAPRMVQACQARPVDDSPATLAFKQGWPSRWQGLRCDSPEDGAVYHWWKKVE